ELSGRENIYLNGAILGMRKAEIKQKFDEIVAFSGVERYIDTPVKRYSSGMYVRLAFAVAAHLESEIMIVDEVLAVGDAEFQKKCLGKMGEVSKGEGRTVLFVSHNMGAIQKLCSSAILLNDGVLKKIGSPEEIINSYLKDSPLKGAIFDVPLPSDAENILGYATKLQIEDLQSNQMNEVLIGRPWQARVFFKLNDHAKHFVIGMGLSNALDINLRISWSQQVDLNKGVYEAVFKEEHLIIAPGTYYLTIGLSNYERAFHYIENVASFTISEIIDPSLENNILKVNNVGLLLNQMTINILPTI
ncbi:MAG: ABC transporter ATP-binding protein, partial [Chitinophagaceae bacterium]